MGEDDSPVVDDLIFDHMTGDEGYCLRPGSVELTAALVSAAPTAAGLREATEPLT